MNAVTETKAAADPEKFDAVLSAISRAMGQVKKIAKEGKNTHDNYSFASIDDFLAAVGPICAEAGLIFHMQETGTEDFVRKGKYADNSWMRMTFEITVYHTSGQHLPPVSRSVEVLRNGAQAYGSAQSYALKQFLRALMLIPTGDKDDADYGEKGEGAIEPSGKAKPDDAKGPAKNDDTRKVYAMLQAQARENKTLEDLEAWWKDPDLRQHKSKLPADWQQNLKDEVLAMVNEFKANDTPFQEAAQ
jgi:hypothetical protein